MKIIREIKVDHLARIEGKAGIEVEISNKGIDAKINVTEGPRFFEFITKDKKYDEAIQIFPRICSFCSVPHKLTPIEAIEQALDIVPSEQTKKLRELLYISNIIYSHVLHLHLFVIPDYLGYPDAFTVAKKNEDLIKNGFLLKDFGAEIQSIIGGRSIHPDNVIVGGFGKVPFKREMEKIKKMADDAIKKSVEIVEFFAEYEYPEYVDKERRHLSIKPHNGYGVYGDSIISSDGSSFPAEKYKDNLIEEIVPYSFAKRSTFKGEPYMVGAISRLVNNLSLLKGETKELAEKYNVFISPKNCFANNFAQAIEIVHFVERAKELASELMKIKEERKVDAESDTGEGYAITEAPRGLLIYYVKIENGLIKDVDIITPTAMFLPMMEVDIVDMANGLWNDGYKDTDLIEKKVEMVTRSYDPCISCSVHVTKL